MSCGCVLCLCPAAAGVTSQAPRLRRHTCVAGCLETPWWLGCRRRCLQAHSWQTLLTTSGVCAEGKARRVHASRCMCRLMLGAETRPTCHGSSTTCKPRAAHKHGFERQCTQLEPTAAVVAVAPGQPCSNRAAGTKRACCSEAASVQPPDGESGLDGCDTSCYYRMCLPLTNCQMTPSLVLRFSRFRAVLHLEPS